MARTGACAVLAATVLLGVAPSAVAAVPTVAAAPMADPGGSGSGSGSGTTTGAGSGSGTTTGAGSGSGATAGSGSAGSGAGTTTGTGSGAAVAATPATITISPNPATGQSGRATAFTVTGRSADGTDLGDVTASSTLRISPDGACTVGSCTPVKPGQHTVTATDGSATATATFRVPDQLPVTQGESYSVDSGATLSVPAPGVLANDTDADGDPLTAKVAGASANGTLALNVDGSFTYTPNADFVGQDTFTYVASDGRTNGTSGPTTVRITVGPPAATGITLNPVSSTGAVGVAQSYTVTQQPGDADVTAAATLTITPDGACTVGSCNPAKPGPHTVTATKDGMRDFATLSVADRLPTAAPDTFTVHANRVLTVPAPGVLANDTDPDGDPLTAAQPGQAAHGTVVLAPDGSFVYTPTPGYVGPDQFSYYARDGRPQGLSAVPATVTLDVTNAAPVAQPDTARTSIDTPLVVPAPGVLGNDSDADADRLTALLGSAPAHGTVVLAPDGSYTYTPALGFTGTDRFTYTATDGIAPSAPATVTITVSAPAGPVRADVVTTLALPGSTPRDGQVSAVVTTRNAGPFTANAVGTVLAVPPGLRITAAPGATVSRDGRAAVFLAARLTPGQAVTYPVTLTADRSATGPRLVVASAGSRTPDPAYRNNIAFGTTTIGARP
ncbi:cadherin-like domain-containing protein [Actinomycetospora chiangmaiensis]|uniref:cadherin-like domain-containing protein n=1 Tax=Actinomycetospora chiangmaiensis TaxID=402650 RepID=UPI0003754A29|nr:cadherin-like domain-containing protein [Actinomycetospora chiangmaiensis]